MFRRKEITTTTDLFDDQTGEFLETKYRDYDATIEQVCINGATHTITSTDYQCADCDSTDVDMEHPAGARP